MIDVENENELYTLYNRGGYKNRYGGVGSGYSIFGI